MTIFSLVFGTIETKKNCFWDFLTFVLATFVNLKPFFPKIIGFFILRIANMSVARPVSILMFIKKSGIFHVPKQGLLALIKGHLFSEQNEDIDFLNFSMPSQICSEIKWPLVDNFMKICDKQSRSGSGSSINFSKNCLVFISKCYIIIPNSQFIIHYWILWMKSLQFKVW